MIMDRVIQTVEAHTGGEPFRIITSGLPKLQGETIVAKRQWIKENHDDVRKSLMWEPRGHPDMYGGYLTQPVSETSDFGIIFIHNEGYSDHCGHGIIALSSIAVRLEWVERTMPETIVKIDAPCGYIKAFVGWDGEKVGNVRFTNVPSFVYLKDVSVSTPSFGEVKGDISFGGAFYFYMNSKCFGLTIDVSQIETLKKLGDEVKTAANIKYKVVHPLIPEINHIYGTIIDNEPNSKDATQANVCIFANKQIDRSPTGSGTAGRLAQLFARGIIKKDEYIVNESIVGSIFKGKVIDTLKFEGYDAVIPEVEGNAYLLGFSNWVIDKDDMLGGGFLVRD